MSEKRNTVGRLADDTGVKPVTIRYYEKIGLLPKATRSESGYRLYSEDDIRELLSLADRRQESCAGVDAKVEQQLVQVRSRLKDLHAMEHELERLSACCDGGVIMDCRIIETLSGSA